MKSYKAQFDAWRKKHGIKVRHHLQAVLPNGMELHTGDIVAYTNPNGVTWSPLKVLGFEPTPDEGRCVYLDWECYWFPVQPDKVRLIYRKQHV